eukprot:3662128-Rhodomonas_salina.1
MSTQRVDNLSSPSVKLLGYGVDSWVPPPRSAIAVPYFYPWTAIKYGSSSCSRIEYNTSDGNCFRLGSGSVKFL